MKKINVVNKAKPLRHSVPPPLASGGSDGSVSLFSSLPLQERLEIASSAHKAALA